MVSYIYTNLPVNAIVRLLHPCSEDSEGQERFLEHSADKKFRIYDTENHHPSLSTQTSNDFSGGKMKWRAI